MGLAIRELLGQTAMRIIVSRRNRKMEELTSDRDADVEQHCPERITGTLSGCISLLDLLHDREFRAAVRAANGRS